MLIMIVPTSGFLCRLDELVYLNYMVYTLLNGRMNKWKNAQGQRDSKWHREKRVQWTEGGAVPAMLEGEQGHHHALRK